MANALGNYLILFLIQHCVWHEKVIKQLPAATLSQLDAANGKLKTLGRDAFEIGLARKGRTFQLNNSGGASKGAIKCKLTRQTPSEVQWPSDEQ